MHPNKFYSAWKILDQLQVKNSYVVRQAIAEHKNLRYSKKYYVTDWLKHIRHWVNELELLGRKIDITVPFEEFIDDFMHEHENDPGTDEYGRLCQQIATHLVRVKEGSLPEPATPDSILQACRSFQRMINYWIEQEVKLKARCPRKSPPSSWTVDIVNKHHKASKGELNVADLDRSLTKKQDLLALSQAKRRGIQSHHGIKNKAGAEETGYWEKKCEQPKVLLNHKGNLFG